jgi:hypothetical protein
MTTGVLAAVGAILLVAPAAATALNPNPISFSLAGNMSVKRDGPAAARLPDGRVLVAGGYNNADGALGSAEIFNPKTNSFSATGGMSVPRYGPIAASLPNGRILVAGGWDNSADLATTEIFNPGTGTFSPGPSMVQARELAGEAPLTDGRILIVGGYSNAAGAVNTTEIFDPKTNSFTAGPTLSAPNYGPSVGPTSGGRVLIAGGYDNHTDTYYRTAFTLHPAANTFTSAHDLPASLYYPGSAPLPMGRVLLAGGYDGDLADYTTKATIFDPATNSFSEGGLGRLAHAREEAAGVELADGRALVAGGYDGSDGMDTAEILSVPSNAFKVKLKGRRVIFSPTGQGFGSVSDVNSSIATFAKKKKKKKPKLVKTANKYGGPGKIIVKVKLTALGKATLRQKGKLRVRASYTPYGGLAASTKLTLRPGK